MTTKDIIYLKSLDPITILDEPSLETIEFVSVMISNPVIMSSIFKVRKQINLPETGMDIKKLVGKELMQATNAGIEIVVDSIALTIDQLRATLNLPESMINQFVLLTCFNACIDLRYFKGFISQPIQFIVGKKNIAGAMFEYPHEVAAILIPYLMSQNQLVKWIKANWKTMESQMDKPEVMIPNPLLLRIHKNTEIAIEIMDLKDNQNKTFSAISTILTDKYPENIKVTKEEWVKDTYYFFKDKPSQLSIPQKVGESLHTKTL